MSLTSRISKHTSNGVLMNFKKAIASQLSQLTGEPETKALEYIELPPKKEFGQFAVIVPKLLANSRRGQRKKRKITKEKSASLEQHQPPYEPKNPTEYTKELAEKFQPDTFIADCTPLGTYLNFNIQRIELIRQVLDQVIREQTSYGTFPKYGEGRTVLIDFSSPNIAKPFHAGHLKSTILGSFLKRIHEALGYKTICVNYLGDWGKQYGLLAVGFNKFGSREQLLQNPVYHLYDVYVRICKEAGEDNSINEEANQCFKKMEDGDESVLTLWREFRELSITEYQSLYKRLNISFDIYSGESETHKDIPKVIDLLRAKGLLQQKDGSLYVDLEKYNLGSPVVKRHDETSLYITRDIAAAIDRKQKYNFDKMLYVVGVSQQVHFQRLFKILEILNSTEYDDINKQQENWANQLQHIHFGIINGMSTRKGTAVFLKDLLDNSQQHMLEIIKENEKKYQEIKEGANRMSLSSSSSPATPSSIDQQQQEDLDVLFPSGEAAAVKIADIVGISAVVIEDFSRDRQLDYDFSWKRMMDSHGNTGVFLQYAHARLNGQVIEEKADVKLNFSADPKFLKDPEAFELAFQIAQYPDTVLKSFDESQPRILTHYLFTLAHTISQAVRILRVKGMNQDLAESRLLLFWTAKLTMGNGLRLLGLKPLEKM
ncbi:5654_t:CDS:2 [Ambispora gerdemannii]|uniref:arginine--tRNA ligase n=1 Tax=Ambispora gerdemannii TaxID=144530 RepID=A0A9N8VCF1_9GLOM|nr:5654_t:CDS:2 [Ambispora gerdemannii]